MNGYTDREILARTLMAEAGNQGPVGMLAAGSVIMNRMRSGGYGQGLQGVILKPGQFSPWNSVTGYAGGEQGQDMAAIRPTKMAYDITDQLLSGQYEDPTGGATHFYNPDLSNPKWGARSGGQWTRIGEHLFGQADAGRGSAAPMASTQGSTTMTMTPDPQPRGGLFSRLFPGMQEDTAASVETDPFANLSRSQRTMLGFAALRDAAASLQGQEGGYFQQALGGFEAAKERERLRKQGLITSQANLLQSAAALQQQIAAAEMQSRLYGTPVDPSLYRMRDVINTQLMAIGGGRASMPTTEAGAAPVPSVTVSPVETAPADGMPVEPEAVPQPASAAGTGGGLFGEVRRQLEDPNIPAAEKAKIARQAAFDFGPQAPDMAKVFSSEAERFDKLAAAEITKAEEFKQMQEVTLPNVETAFNYIVAGSDPATGELIYNPALMTRAGQFISGAIGTPEYRQADAALQVLKTGTLLETLGKATFGALSDAERQALEKSRGSLDLSDPIGTAQTLMTWKRTIDAALARQAGKTGGSRLRPVED